MTLPKKPLPSLRFVLLNSRGEAVMSLIPRTTEKGRVVEGYWAVPGRRVMTTYELTEMCKRRGWLWRIIGDDGRKRRS